ncbi:response regulator transcription factor [Pedobacter sp. BMA]|uniref:response regulator transcription factor n=1 Tax=Pedobacter sp. BMA TaxID=1663685 RepID=UPI000649C1CB|nr:response regulator transcription factor [Pedobacter sp. BMA]KLT64789.1 transcriptional regulator [Pedobacter sp. BMA]
MLQKVLIAEDYESSNISVQKALEDLGISHDIKNQVYYCDDALARIKKAMSEGNPYDLLITDLSFDDDHTKQIITTGNALIKAAKDVQPDLKILVFSVENRLSVAQHLFKECDIDAYVPKGRRDSQDLKLAIETISKGGRYLSGNLKKEEKAEIDYDFSVVELAIISQLAQGTSQKDIPHYLQANSITPFGLSSVEKKLGSMKAIFGFTKNEQLIAYCKDKNII